MKPERKPIFIVEIIEIDVEGRKEKSYVYGNYCPKCSASTKEVEGHEGGLMNCTVCSHIFRAQEVEDRINEFWEKGKDPNKMTLTQLPKEYEEQFMRQSKDFESEKIKQWVCWVCGEVITDKEERLKHGRDIHGIMFE